MKPALIKKVEKPHVKFNLYRISSYRVRKFMEILRRKYPLGVDLNISVTLCKGDLLRDDGDGTYSKLLGSVVSRNNTTDIKITVATNRESPILVYKTIAHEYRHIMQWVNPDWLPYVYRSGGVTDTEGDAQMFGEAVLSYLREHD